jgi:hypothetical protein
MMAMDGIITRVMRTFDFNQDKKLDYIVVWNGNGKFDYDLLNYLASTTNVSQIQAKESPTSNNPGRPREEPHQMRCWVAM